MDASAIEQEKQALITALRLLAATPKSRKILEKKLEAKGYLPQVVEKTLDRLEEKGLMNDKALAQSLFQSLVTQRPSGRRRIAFELERRGIARPLIDEILDKYSLEEEGQCAHELARQKWERWRNEEMARRRKKTFDFLIRRGFDFSLARKVIDTLHHGTS